MCGALQSPMVVEGTSHQPHLSIVSGQRHISSVYKVDIFNGQGHILLQYPDLKIFLDIVSVPDGGDGGINHTSLLSVDRGIGRGRHTTRLGVTRRGKVFVHLRILWKAYHTEMF